MSKRGRPPKVPPDMMRQALVENKDEMYVGGKLRGPTAAIWKVIGKRLKTEARNVYAFAYRQNQVKPIATLDDVERVTNDEASSDGASDSTVEDSIEGFTLTLTPSEWKSIAPGEEGSARKLKKHTWTHVIVGKLWDRFHCACSWAMKRNDIYPHGCYYLTFCGHCTTCGAEVRGHILEEPIENCDVRLTCTLRQTQELCNKSGKKRKLAGMKKSSVVQKMKSSSAYNLRLEMADDLMDWGDPEPAHLFTLKQLRQAKSRDKQTAKIDKDVIVALARLKGFQPYAGPIRDLGYDPFFIHYWSPEQLHIYNSYCRMEGEGHLKISIDATGGVVQPPSRLGNKQKPIFLYQAVVTSSAGQFPVVQMLSSRHTAFYITNWLKLWVLSGARIPQEVVCDESRALLSACAQAFTNTPTLQLYITACYELLTSTESPQRPATYLRMNYAHLMNAVRKWSS